PQPADLVLKLLHARTLHWGRLAWLRMGAPVGVDPVAQRPVMDPQIPCYRSDRSSGLDHHLHRFSLELGTEPATLFGHEHILSIERTCPRSLVHPRFNLSVGFVTRQNVGWQDEV